MPGDAPHGRPLGGGGSRSGVSRAAWGRPWVLFAIFILYGTTIPFNFHRDPDHVRQRIRALSWNPLTRPDGRRASIPDAVQNLMLFMPFGVLGSLACHRRFTSPAVSGAVVLASGVALSALVETLQLLTVDRIAATSDVLTNGLGTLAGVLVTQQGRQRSAALVRDYGSARWTTTAWTYPAVIALAVVLVAAWQPFDFAMDVGSIGSKLRALYRDPWQRGPVTDEGSAVVLYALATIALVQWFRSAAVARAWLKGVACAVVLVIGLELSQALVGSRTPAGSDAAVRLLGVAVGACLVPAMRGPVGSRPWLILLYLACLTSAVISTWSPFQVREQPQAFAWFPMLGYYRNNWFPAISHVIELSLIYFPFGFVLASIHRERSVVTTAFWAALAAAIGVEYGQSWFVDRYPDVTDVAVSALGGGVGAWFGGRGAEMFESALASASATGSKHPAAP